MTNNMKPTIKLSRSIIWKALLALAGAIIITVAVLAYIAYRKSLNSKYIDNKLSESVTAYRFYHGYELKIYNEVTGRYTLEGLSWVRRNSDRDSLAVFCRDGARGYLNVNTGEPAIPEQYSRAWVFSEGLAAVVKDGQIGFINSQGETVIPFGYCYADRCGYPMDYVFHDGYCVMTADADGTCGIIDRSGKWVIGPEYDFIYPQEEGRKYRIVEREDKCGLLDENLKLIFPVVYDSISFSDEGGLILTRDGYRWRADFDGTVLDPFLFSGTEPLYYPSGNDCIEYERSGYYDNVIRETLSDTYLTYEINGRYGVVRKDNGKVVIPALYEDIAMLSPTLFEVTCGHSARALFDADGKIVENRPVLH